MEIESKLKRFLHRRTDAQNPILKNNVLILPLTNNDGVTAKKQAITTCENKLVQDSIVYSNDFMMARDVTRHPDLRTAAKERIKKRSQL